MYWQQKHMSYSQSHRDIKTEDYSDSESEYSEYSDEEPAPRSHQHYKQPAKPSKAHHQKPKSQHKPLKSQHKPLKSREHYVDKRAIYGCKLCDKTYTSLGSLNRHFTTIHGLEKEVRKPKKQSAGSSKALTAWAPSPRFRCRYCSKELSSKASLERHIDTIHRRSPVRPVVKPVRTNNVTLNVYNSVTHNHYNTSNNFMRELLDPRWPFRPLP